MIGGGFDVIGGFFNINMMLVVENETISDKLFNRIHWNWETSFGTIKFIPINSDEMENLLLNNRLSAFVCICNFKGNISVVMLTLEKKVASNKLL